MANPNNQITIPNVKEPVKPLLAINISFQHNIKLNSANYLSWKLQFHAMLVGYNLDGYVDGSHLAPAATVMINNQVSPNPACTTWIHQDKLIFSAIVGSPTPSIIPLIQCTTTSQEAWTNLINTYAKPTRGHIKQIKDQLKRTSKRSRSISKYMQFIKSWADELAVLGKPLDDEDLIEKILDGLDDDYRPLVDAINGRDTMISFDEHHEKLIIKELILNQSRSSSASLLATVNLAVPHTRLWLSSYPSPTSSAVGPQSSSSHGPHPPSKPYLGFCQACNTQGHTAKCYPLFDLVASQFQHSRPPQQLWQPRPSSSWQP
ncbi:hypothetical protein JRO89_XS06G0107500 [Xanthoceras sorbifolium]|uniref:Retrotransposon Copia-like N-terminal domain-containing protein n=1 Tax=Xanthoceras sorbifolium TaxID=99658 RepID=A0ABQ8HXM1_9ROSI|nr:hypothetical protein JRO89_XS06G0107500 [Xanthoceras sorbifolium]